MSTKPKRATFAESVATDNNSQPSNANRGSTKDKAGGANFIKQRQRRQSGLGGALRGGLKQRGKLGMFQRQATNQFNNTNLSHSNVQNSSSLSQNAYNLDSMSQHEEEMRVREQFKKQRQAALFLAFGGLSSRIQFESNEIDTLTDEKRLSEIQNLPMVKMLAHFDEYSEYENIFTGNRRAEIATKDLNRRIQELAAEAFKGVQFAKDYQESNSRTDQPFDSDDSDQPAAAETDREIQFVKEQEVIFCNEFHEELERQSEEDRVFSRWKHQNSLNSHSFKAQSDKKEKEEQIVKLQSQLMINILKRILKTLHSQLSGETDIVQCFLLEIKDIQDMQPDVNIGQLKRFHRECFFELKRIVQQVQVDRFMLFLIEFAPESMNKFSRKKKEKDECASVSDFLIRSSIKMLKRTCKFILAFNYLLVHRKMSMLSEVGSHLKIFVTETCDLLIEKLQIFKTEQESLEGKLEREYEHIQASLKAEADLDKPFALQPSRQTSTKISSYQTSLFRQMPVKKLEKNAEEAKNQSQLIKEKLQKMTDKVNNTKKALKITKTLFGMVDEMDQTDFCAQKDNAQVVLLKEKSETGDLETTANQQTLTQQDQKTSSADILDLVNQIEQKMGTFKYSKLKAAKKEVPPPTNLARQTAHPFYEEHYLHDQTQFEQSSESSLSVSDPSFVLQHAQEPLTLTQVKDLIPDRKSAAEDPDAFLNQFFLDPFKYHQLAKEADANMRASVNKVEDFMAYQEGDKLTKRSPAVTFGKGGRRPPQNGIAVEESPSVPASSIDQNNQEMRQQGFELDLTQIQHEHTASEIQLRDIMNNQKNFFSLNEENKSGDEEQKYLGSIAGQPHLTSNLQEENFIKTLAHLNSKEIAGLFISGNRQDTFDKQVIPKEKLQEILKLQENKRNNFQEILTNLLYSANNPFQAELPQIHDLSFQQKTEARMKHDFVVSGSLAYIFYGKHLTFKAMMNDHIKEEERRGREGGDLLNVMQDGSVKNQAMNEMSMEGGVNSEIAQQELQTAHHNDFKLDQIRDNIRFAMSKASRFLDTSLKVSELEHREKIYDKEIDDMILRLENEVQQEELYDSIKPGTKVSLLDDDLGLRNQANDPDQDSEIDVTANSKHKRRKTREEQQREEMRINRLLQMHTMDFKFYRPDFADLTSDIQAKVDGHSSLGNGKVKQPNYRETALQEMQVKQSKFLLMRLRNEEMNLRKSAFEREKKGFDEQLFEANSSEHRQNIEKEQDALRTVIQHLSEQYRKQLSFRDPALQHIIEKESIEQAANESFIEMNNSDLELARQQYDEHRGSEDKRKMISKHGFNTSKVDLGQTGQPISMLEMAFNEINPYREQRFGAGSLKTSDSMNLTGGLAGLNGQSYDSAGGSMQVGKNEKLLNSLDKEDENYMNSAHDKVIESSFAGTHNKEMSFYKNRVSEQIIKKRPQIGALLNQSKVTNSFNEENKLVSTNSSMPKEPSKAIIDQTLDPSYVMGMGQRRNRNVNNPNAGPGFMDSLEDSALLQFQELTGLGIGAEMTQQQQSSAGFGGVGTNQDSGGLLRGAENNTLSFNADLKDQVKRAGLESPSKGNPNLDELMIEDLDGGYTPEFQEKVKQMILKRQRTQTVQ